MFRNFSKMSSIRVIWVKSRHRWPFYFKTPNSSDIILNFPQSCSMDIRFGKSRLRRTSNLWRWGERFVEKCSAFGWTTSLGGKTWNRSSIGSIAEKRSFSDKFNDWSACIFLSIGISSISTGSTTILSTLLTPAPLTGRRTESINRCPYMGTRDITRRSVIYLK